MIDALITRGLGYAVKYLITRGLGIGTVEEIVDRRELTGVFNASRSLAGDFATSRTLTGVFNATRNLEGEA